MFQGGGVDFSTRVDNAVVELPSWQSTHNPHRDQFLIDEDPRISLVLIFSRGIVFSAGAEVAPGRPAIQQYRSELILYEI